MPSGPVNYFRERLGRSINSRVMTAMKIADDVNQAQQAQWRADVTDLVDEVRAAQVEFVERNLLLLRELEERIKADLAGAQGSVGAVSSHLTDTLRRQNDVLERLARRVQALEQSSGSSVRATPLS